MNDNNNPTVAELIARLQSTTNTANKALTHADRALREIDRVKERFHGLVAEDHDSIVELQLKVEKLEKRGGNITFADLILSGFTAAEAKAILDIKSEGDLTDEMVMLGLVSSIKSLRKEVNGLNELAVVQVEETMKLRENVAGLDGRVTRLEQAPAPIAATISAQRKITRREKWMTLAVALVAMLLWGMRDFDNTVTINDQSVGITSPADTLFVTVMVGAGTALLLMAFFYLFDFSGIKMPRRKKSEKPVVVSTPVKTTRLPATKVATPAPAVKKTAKQEADEARRLLNMSDEELAAQDSGRVFDQDATPIVITPAQQPLQVTLN